MYLLIPPAPSPPLPPGGVMVTSHAVLTGHSSHVYSCCFSPDGRLLASVSADKSLILWEMVSVASGDGWDSLRGWLWDGLRGWLSGDGWDSLRGWLLVDYHIYIYGEICAGINLFREIMKRHCEILLFIFYFLRIHRVPFSDQIFSSFIYIRTDTPSR